MSSFQDSVSINTLIGPGSFFKGDLTISGFIRIDGDINGNIETNGRIIIGENARIKGNIKAHSVTVGGVVQGDIISAENINILSSGIVLGDLITKKINLEEKVVFSGKCFAINDESKYKEHLSNYYNQKAYKESLASSIDKRWK